MIGRALWFAAGTGVGVYGAVKAKRVAYRLSPVGLQDRAAAWGLGLRELAQDVRVGAAEREQQLLDELGLAPPPADGRALEGAGAPALARSPRPVRRDAP